MALGRPHKNQKVVDLLRARDAEGFERWHREHPGPIDLIGADLDRIQFPAVDLSDALIESADITGSNLSELKGFPKNPPGSPPYDVIATKEQWDTVIIPCWLRGKRV